MLAGKPKLGDFALDKWDGEKPILVEGAPQSGISYTLRRIGESLAEKHEGRIGLIDNENHKAAILNDFSFGDRVELVQPAPHLSVSEFIADYFIPLAKSTGIIVMDVLSLSNLNGFNPIKTAETLIEIAREAKAILVLGHRLKEQVEGVCVFDDNQNRSWFHRVLTFLYRDREADFNNPPKTHLVITGNGRYETVLT